MRLSVPRFDSASAKGVVCIVGYGWLALVATLSLIPSPPSPPGPLGWDKAQHALAYGFLAWWWLQALEGRRALAVVVALIGYGILIECLQGLSGIRHFSVADMIANTVGVALGLFLCATPAGRVLAALGRWSAGRRS